MSSLIPFILGAVVGSFLNVCIHRLPRGESIVAPSSHCPNCAARLSPQDLIPIFGYFLLGGRCRYCRVKISFRYPLVEFLTAVSFAGIALMNQSVTDFVFRAVFVSVLIVIFFTDLEHQVIPDGAAFLGIGAGLVYNFFRGSILLALLGAALGFLLLYSIGGLGKLWFKKEAMGEGDWLVGALLGAYLSWDGVLLSIFLASVFAAAAALILMILGKVRMGQYVPFGPALAAGGVLTLFFGSRIINWYWAMFL